jgi:retron-type reverse transcriptase
MAWEKVKRNRGAGGIDGEDIAAFEVRLEEQLERLHCELRDDTYAPQPVMRQLIPKAGQPGKHRALGIPTIYDRVCQQAILNRLEPIFDEVFDEASFGYRKGRSTKDALRKVWRELEQGNEWVVDADLRDFFGSPALRVGGITPQFSFSGREGGSGFTPASSVGRGTLH